MSFTEISNLHLQSLHLSWDSYVDKDAPRADLYGDLTIQKLQKDDYQSRIRNKLVAEAFYLTRDIEKYGTGFLRIRKEIISYPTMLLSCEERGDVLLVSLSYKTQKTTSQPVVPVAASEGINEGVSEGISEGISGGINGGISGGISVGINSLLKHILTYPGQRV